MEKKHMHGQHSRLVSSRYLSHCRGSDRCHLWVILLFGVFCICLLIALLVANTQYNNDKGRLTKDLEDCAKTTSELNDKSEELKKALKLVQQKGDNKCIPNEELQKNLTDRLRACDATLINITKEREQLIVKLMEQTEKGSVQNLSEQNGSKCILNEGNEPLTLSDNLTACLEDRGEKLSFISQERAVLNTKLRKTSNELLRLCHLFKNASCPAGWLMVNCSCYKLSGTGTWNEAREDCISKGADLVVIDDVDEQQFFEKLPPGPNVWIGLTDRETEGSWQWLDGTSITSEFSEKYQSDSGDGDGQHEEKDCAHVKYEDGWVWEDSSCHDYKLWVCEKIATLF